MAALEVGTKAPDFELKAAQGDNVRLSDLLAEGRYVTLAFYPAAWSPVCGDEMTLFQEFLDEFEALNTRLAGISVDNVWAVQAWAQTKGITFPLLCDFHPKGAVAEQYGVMRDDGVTERALFVVDPEGTVRYSYVSPITENPGVDRLFDVLEELEEEQ